MGDMGVLEQIRSSPKEILIELLAITPLMQHRNWSHEQVRTIEVRSCEKCPAPLQPEELSLHGQVMHNQQMQWWLNSHMEQGDVT